MKDPRELRQQAATLYSLASSLAAQAKKLEERGKDKQGMSISKARERLENAERQFVVVSEKHAALDRVGRAAAVQFGLDPNTWFSHDDDPSNAERKCINDLGDLNDVVQRLDDTRRQLAYRIERLTTYLEDVNQKPTADELEEVRGGTPSRH